MSSDRRFWIAYGCLVAVGVFLGLQTHRAVESVLHSGSMSSAGVRPEAESDRALFDELARKDEALAVRTDAIRDPFQTTATAAAWGASDVPKRERRLPPVLRALLYDGRRPVVQLQSGRSQSGWLGVGDVYQGWTIDEINADSVRLSRSGSSIVLASS
jgi:hypothetical protein